MKVNKFPGVALAAAVLVFCWTTALFAGSPAAPGNSTAFGESLAGWHELYWSWLFGQTSLPADNNGNAVVGGNVVLMPIPNENVDVQLYPGQSFVLPLWSVFLTSYNDGTADDPVLDLSIFETLDISFVVDGTTVIDGDNVMNYYSEFPFVPVIPYNSGYYKDLIYFQGVGLVHPPLTPGTHTMALDAKNTEPVVDAKGDAWTYEYHNTWNITVKR